MGLNLGLSTKKGWICGVAYYDLFVHSISLSRGGERLGAGATIQTYTGQNTEYSFSAVTLSQCYIIFNMYVWDGPEVLCWITSPVWSLFNKMGCTTYIPG